ncbi:MAG: ANTAR domain-containing protein [Clostridia bacterium]|nr:ANTAR domain-containing protein [Clostridia bacterium]
MRTVLLVTPNLADLEWFREDLAKLNIEETHVVKTAGEARRILIERVFDLLVINAPLSDENGVRLAADVIGNKANQVILMVKREYADEIASKVEDYGIFTVEKPLSHAAFWLALKMTSAAYNRTRNFINENDRLKKSLADIRLVNRAKCLLIEKLGLSEDAAHREMEKMAMDHRLEKVELAKRIIREYED